jgi:hypothetical protein
VTCVGLVLLLVGAFVSPVLCAVGAAVTALGVGVVWVLDRTRAGRRMAARDALAQADRARQAADAAARTVQQRREAAESEQERRTEQAARTLHSAVEALLEELPGRGASRQEALTFCLSRAGLSRDPRLRAEAERLARRHVAVDERMLCVARSGILDERRRPALLILTDRGAAVADKGLSYRCNPAPEDVLEVPETGWAQLRVGELVFDLSRNPQLRIALAARTRAAETGPLPARVGRPEERLIRTARDAELVAVDWMRHLGFTDAVATPVGADAGVDVTAERAVAQVKKEGSPTSRPTVQQLHGVAAAQDKTALFFSFAGYTPPAIDWADEHGIALFQYDLQGTPTPVNPPAQRLTESLGAPASAAGAAHGVGLGGEGELARQAERAGLRVETLQDIARAVITEQRATMVLLQERFFLTRAQARRALEALEQLGLVSAPAAHGRRTVTAEDM